MSFNLINQISAEDKAKIEKFISLYGVRKDSFIGIDSWLKPWSDNKIKMYKMLGNQLIYRTPFKYTKSEGDLRQQLTELIEKDKTCGKILVWFKESWDEYFSEDKKDKKEKNENAFYNDIKSDLYWDIRSFIYDCFSVETLIKDSTHYKIKFKLNNSNKTFQVQSGAKPLRALGRFLTYCKDIEGVNELINMYENFRIAHSMIFNDKEIKGTLAISIHPLDYMTMSDNNSNWHSCMSWMNDGCYHVGTVEMMNSNNVLCCYIENSEPFYFGRDNKKVEEYKWANKKWRQLVYFTKDIIVSGKPYPYYNDEFSKFIIETIRSLAEKNLKWTYSFGPELYKDMIHINGNRSMNRAKKFIRKKDMKKHNIIFDTKGMYNDMLNDNETNYWCVRNKVKHNKVISYSGKAPCLCCGNSALRMNDDSYDDYSDYNERYYDTGRLICSDCYDNFNRCDICSEKDPTKKFYTLYTDDDRELHICEDCAKEWIKICPSCGDKMLTPYYGEYYNFLNSYDRRIREFIKLNDKLDESILADAALFSPGSIDTPNGINKKFNNIIYPICRCAECSEKDGNNFNTEKIVSERWWYTVKTKINISKKIERKSDWKNYFPWNLENVKVNDGDIIKL